MVYVEANSASAEVVHLLLYNYFSSYILLLATYIRVKYVVRLTHFYLYHRSTSSLFFGQYTIILLLLLLLAVTTTCTYHVCTTMVRVAKNTYRTVICM